MWLGRVSSDGSWAAGAQLSLGPGQRATGYSISRDSQGQIAIAGQTHTDLVDFTESVGLFLKSGSLDQGFWRPNGMQGRPSSNTKVRLIDEHELVVAGSLRYADNARAAFVAKVDYRGTKRWAIDQTGWGLSSVYDIEVDSDGAIYALGGIRELNALSSERAVMVKIDAQGKLLWQRDLEPAGQASSAYSRATELALSLDQTQLWSVGVHGASMDEIEPRAWKLAALDGAVLSSVALESSSLFQGGMIGGFSGLLVRHDGIYYSWNARAQVGEDLLGHGSRLARMNEQGETNWKVEYGTQRGPGAVPHVMIRGLKEAAGGGIYLFGHRDKVPVPDAPSQGESYGYVARFCPPP